MEFKPTQEAELRKHQQRVDEWLDPNDRLNVLDNEMYLARVNPDGSNRANLPSIDNVHDHDIDEYVEMSLRELCEVSVEAEINNDRTTMSSVDDYILDKIDGMDLEDDYVERDSTLREKSELDQVYDRVIKLRENIKRNKLLENPSEVSNLEEDQVNKLANNWESQTGQKIVWQNKKDAVVTQVNEEKEMLALPPAPEADSSSNESDDDAVIIDDDSSDSNDLPRIIVHDDDDDILDLHELAGDYMPNTQESEELDNVEKSKRKITKRQKIIAGSLAMLAAGALLFGFNSRTDSSNNNEPATTVVEDEPVDTIAPSQDVLDQLEQIDAEAENSTVAEASTTADTEEVAVDTDAESQALKVALYQETGALIEGKVDATNIKDLDASKIQVSGDVMPYTNAVNAGAENPDATVRASLTVYNQAHPENQFEYRDDGMFWSISENRIMNPTELSQYNELMKFIAENI